MSAGWGAFFHQEERGKKGGEGGNKRALLFGAFASTASHRGAGVASLQLRRSDEAAAGGGDGRGANGCEAARRRRRRP